MKKTYIYDVTGRQPPVAGASSMKPDKNLYEEKHNTAWHKKVYLFNWLYTHTFVIPLDKSDVSCKCMCTSLRFCPVAAHK